MTTRPAFWYLLTTMFVATSLGAQSEVSQSAWETLILENHTLEYEASPLERKILQLMTREQFDAYTGGASPAQIVLSTGETLEAFLTFSGLNTFDIPWYSIDGGGGMFATGGDFELSGTIGQPDAGLMNNNSLILTGGFWVRSNFGPPTLSIPTEIPAVFGAPVDVPILFNGNGFDIAATTFSVDYDEACLGFNPTDSDFDGNLDNVSLSLPAGFDGEVTFDPGDADGELDFVIVDPLPPLISLPDSTIATITLMTLCEPIDTPIVAAVGFSQAPPPTFGDTEGHDAAGGGVDGSIAIYPGMRGDCNGDGQVSAGDLPACVLEVFDGDGDFWLEVPGGGFPGVPAGCDANADETINAGDLSCKILLIFEGSGACSAARQVAAGWDKPSLFIGELPQIGDRKARRSVPVYFQPRGWAINSLVFSVDFDEQVYAFDPSDRDGDGFPDALRFDLPASVQVTVGFDREDTDGEIDVSILDPNQTITRGARAPLLTITFKPLTLTSSGKVGVTFSQDPSPSFGDLSGQSVDGSSGVSRHQ